MANRKVGMATEPNLKTQAQAWVHKLDRIMDNNRDTNSLTEAETHTIVEE